MPEQPAPFKGTADQGAEQRHRLLEEITGVSHSVGELYHQSTEQLQAILDASPAVIYAKDLEGRFLLVNREFEKLFSVSRQDVFGNTDHSLFPADIADQMRRNDLDVAASGQPIEREEVAPHSDGPHTYLSLKFPLHDQAGAVSAVCGISMDITERKRAEEAVRRSERELRALAETVPQLVWTLGPDGEPEYVNRRWADYTGLTPEESHRLGLAGQVHPDDVAPTLGAWAASQATGDSFEAEYRLRGADGTFRWFLARGVPVCDDEGRIRRWFGTSTDIDERRRGEAAQRFLTDLGERMHGAADPDRLLQAVVDGVGQHLGVTRCTYGEVDRTADTLVVYPGYRPDGISTVSGAYPLASFGPEIITDLEAGQTVVVSDVARDPRTAREAEQMYAQVSSRAFVSVPVVNDGRWVFALIVSVDGHARAWAPDEVALLETVAERTWLALENARLFRAEKTATVLRQQFLKDVMASVTDGRLILCDELPLVLPPSGGAIALSRQAGLGELRRRVQKAVEDLQFTDARWHDLVTAVGEAGMNAVVHAGAGEGRVCVGAGSNSSVDHGSRPGHRHGAAATGRAPPRIYHRRVSWTRTENGASNGGPGVPDDWAGRHDGRHGAEPGRAAAGMVIATLRCRTNLCVFGRRRWTSD